MTLAPSTSGPTVGGMLRWGRDRLRLSPSASLDAQLLLAHLLGVARPHVLAHDVDLLSPDQVEHYIELIERRGHDEPLAYLRGAVEWYGVDYLVTPDVLIPRPETELLLERALEAVRAGSLRVLADIGTGSGTIASQLAVQEPEASVYGTDVSVEALRVAAANVRRLGVDRRVTLLHGNLLEPLTEAPDLIVANLPYLSDDMMNVLEPSVRHEPVIALRGGKGGLGLYRELLVQVMERGWRCPLIFEIDPRQAIGARELVQDILPGRSVEIDRDYAGHDRIVTVGVDG